MEQVIERMLRQGRGFPGIAGWATLSLLCLLAVTEHQARAEAAQASGIRTALRSSGRPPGKPAYLWLWYADGTPTPTDGPYCVGMRPSAFKCNYGATIEDCQRQVQTYLDAWYADFNLVFSLTRPASDDYYTTIITSTGIWCSQDDTQAGFAPPNYCNDTPLQTTYVFECGYSAHACAAMIAHEHGHAVGLQHTDSTTDVMNPYILPTAAGFDDLTNATLDDQCGRPTQNSYQQMLSALGTWPGGAKPGPFATLPDAGAPDLPPAYRGDAPAASGSVGPGTTGAANSDGGVTSVPGYDALARPPLPTVDGTSAQNSEPSGGCSLAHARASAPVSAMVLLFVLALLARRTGLRRSTARASRFRARRP